MRKNYILQHFFKQKGINEKNLSLYWNTNSYPLKGNGIRKEKELCKFVAIDDIIVYFYTFNFFDETIKEQWINPRPKDGRCL